MNETVLTTLLAVAFIAVCLFMMLVILIQKPKGGGLSGAFGGAGGGSAQAAFGAKTGDVLTWFTVICFTLFVLTAMGLVWIGHPPVEETSDAFDAILGPRPGMIEEPEATDDQIFDMGAGVPLGDVLEDETPSETPEATPEATPQATPEATPDAPADETNATDTSTGDTDAAAEPTPAPNAGE